MKAKELYHVAVYLRLSRDDISSGSGKNIDSGKAESNSISSQRDMIRSYIRKQGNMEIYDIYAEMKIANLIQFENLNTQEMGRNKGLLTYLTMSEAFIFMQSSRRKKIRGFST